MNVNTNNQVGSKGSIGQEQQPSRIPTKTLDQQDFLKILVAQMTTQDPLSPKGDMDFVTQMTQFSMLEGFRTMQTDMTGLRSGQEFSSAESLLGRTVEIDAGSDDRVLGVVSAMRIESGKPKVIVGGRSYDAAKIVEVSPSNVPPAVQSLAISSP